MSYIKKIISVTYELNANNIMIGYLNCIYVNGELNIDFLIKETKLFSSNIQPLKIKIDSEFNIDDILLIQDVKNTIPSALLDHVGNKYLVVYEIDPVDTDSHKIKLIEWRNGNEQFYMAENMRTKKLLSFSDRSIEEVIQISMENLL